MNDHSLLSMVTMPEALAIYVHWPFCQSICPYCHFNRYRTSSISIPSWEEAFLQTITHWGGQLSGRVLTSVFFGGGTPSLMPPSLIKTLLEALFAQWPPAPELEITLEMNPTEAALTPEFAQAGINRISMGIQSFYPETLALLGRTHRPCQLYRALRILKSSGLRYSFDLIYGHAHHQKETQWANELDQAFKWADDHVSLYHLSYEKGTPFYALRTQALEDEKILALEAQAELFFVRQGWTRYEISNYAKPGAESRHNLTYWQYGDYLGLGPGAHSRISRGNEKLAMTAHALPDQWQDTIQNGDHGMAKIDVLSQEQQVCEQLLMGLRLSSGMNLPSGPLISDRFFARVAHCRQHGLIQPQKFALTSKGRALLNSVVAYLCADFFPAVKSKESLIGSRKSQR